jgi:hypothetical protein
MTSVRAKPHFAQYLADGDGRAVPQLAQKFVTPSSTNEYRPPEGRNYPIRGMKAGSGDAVLFPGRGNRHGRSALRDQVPSHG